MNNGKIKPGIWNAKIIMHLPSGQEVKVRNAHVFDLVKIGILPTGILQNALKLSMFVKDGKLDISKTDENDFHQLMEIVDKFVMYAVKEPVIVKADPREDEICIDDVPTLDKMEIFSKLSGKQDGLPQFFSRKKQRAANTPVGDDIRTETK